MAANLGAGAGIKVQPKSEEMPLGPKRSTRYLQINFGMDRHAELQKLTADACDALRAATDILSDDSLPIEARIQAHDRCMAAFRKLLDQIPDIATLAITQAAGRGLLVE